jgi:hypothetical protein
MPSRLTEDEISVVSGIASAASVLSIFGSSFILCCYFAYPHLRKFSFTLVAILSATDICNQIFDLIDPPADEMAAMAADPSYVSSHCMVQAVGDNFFQLASVYWTTAIAATLYMTVMWRWKLNEDRRTFSRFAAVCFGIPLVLTILPAFDSAYGAAGGICWMKETKEYWRFIAFFVPLWLAVLFNSVVYVRVLRLLHRTVSIAGPDDAVAQSIRTMMTRLSIYPFILVAVWLFASISRIYEAATGNQSMALYVLGLGLADMQGFLNALAYGLSGAVRGALKDSFSKRCGSCMRRESVATQSLINAHPHEQLTSRGAKAENSKVSNLPPADEIDDSMLHIPTPAPLQSV